MRWPITKAIVGVLIAAQVIYGAPSSPSPKRFSEDIQPSHELGQKLRRNVQTIHLDESEALPSKRANNVQPQVHMFQRPTFGTTWWGHVQEPPNSGWSKRTIRDLAREGWRQASRNGEITIVAAFWRVGHGVWLGSIPHGGGQQQFGIQLRNGARKLNQVIGQRERTDKADPPPSMWHAEDAALFLYEESLGPNAPVEGRYSDFCYLAAYGQLHADNTPSAQDPCGGPSARVRPSCFQTLRALGIAFG